MLCFMFASSSNFPPFPTPGSYSSNLEKPSQLSDSWFLGLLDPHSLLSYAEHLTSKTPEGLPGTQEECLPWRLQDSNIRRVDERPRRGDLDGRAVGAHDAREPDRREHGLCAVRVG
jgi:hypothetical protein